VFELERDGFRALAYIDDGHCQLISRRNLMFRIRQFEGFVSKTWHEAVLYGELVCLNSAGRSILKQRHRMCDENMPNFSSKLLPAVGRTLTSCGCFAYVARQSQIINESLWPKSR
jgi:hypothetical protein